MRSCWSRQPEQMLDPLLVGLDVPVEQRAMGRDPQPVSRVVHVEPLVRMLLAGRDQATHAVREHLRAPAGQRAEPCRLQLAERLLVRDAGQHRHVVDLRRRVHLQEHVRKRLVQRPHGVDVEVEADVRGLAVDDVDLGEPRVLVLPDRVGRELLGARRVRALLLLGARERAELALHAADVRLVEVQVLDEVDTVVAAAHAACRIRQVAEPEQVVRLEQREPVLEIEALTREHLLADRLQRVYAVDDGHYECLCTTAWVSDSSSSRLGAPFRHARALAA